MVEDFYLSKSNKSDIIQVISSAWSRWQAALSWTTVLLEFFWLNAFGDFNQSPRILFEIRIF